MKVLLPLILILLGTGAGVGAGLFLKPPAEEHAEAETGCAAPGPGAHSVAEAPLPEILPADQLEYVLLQDQFVVPLVKEDALRSLVVLGLSIETKIGNSEQILAHEPKLRDMFLQIMFDHANAGGFEGAFTNSSRLDSLRKDFRNVARRHLGDIVRDVLITDIAKQEL